MDETQCTRAPFGWWCSRDYGHNGPCAARPRWWNIFESINWRPARYYRKGKK